MRRSIILLLSIFILFLWFQLYKTNSENENIRVGILHSSTGNMAMSERNVIEATKASIDEINRKGGLLGKKLEAVVIDGASNSQGFYAGANKLIQEEKVDVVFGCWTSASRKTVKPLFEKYDHLLVYPVQFEGLETSPNIFYTGTTPNQQAMPAIKWALDNVGKRLYLVGSDYIYPKATNTLIKAMLENLNIHVVGEGYIPLGSKEVGAIVDDIKKKEPDLIINTINGSSNLHFFKALYASGLSAASTPAISFSLTESEYRSLLNHDINMSGNYAALSCLCSNQKQKNIDFQTTFKKLLNRGVPITDPMISSHLGVQLWAKAVKASRTSNPKIIKNTILRQNCMGPNGIVFSDEKERKLFRRIFIGQVTEKGDINKAWEYDKPIPPITFPSFYTIDEWNSFLTALYTEYDQKWER